MSRGELLGLLDAPAHPARNAPAATPDEADAHALPIQLVASRDEQALVEVHEEAHLVERAPPVLGRERVDGEPLEADLERALDRVEQRFLAGGMALGALQAPTLRPPSVAVHHDRNVPRAERLHGLAT